MKIVVVGGGIAGLAAARRLESALSEAQVALVEREDRPGGKLRTERVEGFVIEAAADSFLSRKERGVGLCEELGLAGELVGRRPEHARSFVRHGAELHALPEGLTGMIPTNLDALSGGLLSDEGTRRVAVEVDLPPAPEGDDESIASFVSRRLGREAYERIVEPLLSGIFGGNGEQLSLRATFPELRALELEYGSLLRGLRARRAGNGKLPPFVTLRGGIDVLVTAVVASLERTELLTGRTVTRATRGRDGYRVELDEGETITAAGVVVAAPAFAGAEILADLDPELAGLHEEIPYASSAVVTLAYRVADVPALDGYGYVVPRIEGGEVVACTWSSRKWEGRSPDGTVLIRVYLGRFGGRDVTGLRDDELLDLGREEVRVLGITAEPILTRTHRWPRGMPQYVLGHPDRVERIEQALERHPGLALAGSAYRGVGIPDCIRSGEEAAESVARALSVALR